MLATILSELDPKTAAASLATAVLSLGSPGLPRENDEIVTISEKLILEAIKELNIVDRSSTESIGKLRMHLGEFVDYYLMKGFNRSDIFKKLGDRGNLPRGAYTVSLNKYLLGKQSLSFVEKCVRYADSEQHLMTEDGEDAHKLSIFVKEIVNNSNRRSIIVICASRAGDSLIVDCLFQMLPQLFDLSKALVPVDYIREFIKKYPVNFKIGKMRIFKSLWENEIIPTNGQKLEIECDPEFTIKNKDTSWSTLVYGKMLDGAFEAVMAFGFNDKVYRSDLEKG